MKRLLLSLLLVSSAYGHQAQHDLVPIRPLDQSIVQELWYATPNNFTKVCIYPSSAQAYLEKGAAHALVKVQKKLKAIGLGLKIWDAYRPFSAQEKMWEVVPDERYVSNPKKAKVCGHNRGGSVDLTLVSLKTGKELAMPTGFDDFSNKAHSDCMNCSQEAIKNRALLHSVMKEFGFTNYKGEWRHFNYQGFKDHPILNISFEELDA